ncbi:esterase [Herbiconiux sp. 11R-BC]|uniref:alpha/beta hydrolase n=1 Tax=Herbiconiux sp. 11R-BC TaxID=3111637 RepID=UPI003C0C2DE1
MTALLHAVHSESRSTDAAIAPGITVLLLHGYGSNEQDLTGIVPALGLSAPWSSLRAPIELGHGGAAWFAISTPGDPDPEPLAEATDAIWAWVDATRGDDSLVLPIGFSQGGLMASQLLRTRPERVVAPVVLGGFVQRSPQPGDAHLAETRPPLFWGRGAEDRVIGSPAIQRTSAFLPAHTALVERIYPGLAHGISAQELADVREFIAKQAPAAVAAGR